MAPWTCFAIAVLALQTLAAELPLPSSDDVEAGREALARFSETPPYLNPRENQDRLRSEVQIACMPFNAACLRYIRDNRSNVLAAMPDNPGYWEVFWAVLGKSPLMTTPAEALKPDRRESDKGALMNAASIWPLYYLAKHGELDIDKTHKLMLESRRLIQESRYMLDWMIFVAMHGISFNAINVVMHQNAGIASNDRRHRLIDAMLTRLSTRELSIRNIMDGEREYQETIASPAELEHVSPQILESGVVLSERPWGEFWGDGIDVVNQGLLTDTVDQDWLLDGGIVWSSSYVTMRRAMDATLIILRELREFYDGNTPIGIPTRPPPQHWDWLWKESDSELCLTPVTVHPTIRADDICVPFLGSR